MFLARAIYAKLTENKGLAFTHGSGSGRALKSARARRKSVPGRRSQEAQLRAFTAGFRVQNAGRSTVGLPPPFVLGQDWVRGTCWPPARRLLQVPSR